MISEHLGLDAMAAQAAEYIEELIPAVLAAGKPAKVTITVTLKPPSAGLAVAIEGKVRMRPPEQPRDTTSGWWAQLWWDGEAVRTDDPTQPRLLGAVS